MRKKQIEIQLGKKGISEDFIKTIQDMFKTHDHVRISVLKSAGHEKNKVKDFSEQILEGLGDNYTSKIIGFTIVIKRWRKPVR